ncbi:MAG TPA: carboxypeptidase-like regulatory domain-containing protein [Candidatus Polarisedimenticolaceae bacterium]|nr:carboxypeptidase-like regulatory domain-containing protein [Candidatus Polarisedimenticolaceae bacterium]
MLALAPRLRRSTAIAVTLGLFMMVSSGVLFAGTPSTLSGRVLGANGADPRSGVVVTLVDPASETMYKSSPTDAKGAFSIGTAPAGNYALVVEAPEGAFLASSNLQLAPGVNRPVALALKPGKQGTPAPAGAPAGTPPPSAKKGLPTWAKWVIAGGIVVGAAIVVDAVTSNSNNEASSF